MTLNPDDFTRDELVAKAEAMGASTGGTKADLAAAIEAAEANFDPSNVEGTIAWERKHIHADRAAARELAAVEIEAQKEAATAVVENPNPIVVPDMTAPDTGPAEGTEVNP